MPFLPFTNIIQRQYPIEIYFLSDTEFFRKFKQQYSLQGVDGKYLDDLENKKQRILELIEIDDIATLYFEFFAKAKIKHGNQKKEKNLGSFFAKLIHTFVPEKYSALDNPIKEYLGLAKESFYISLFVINEAYREWITENPEIIGVIRAEAGNYSKEKMTDLKLLDLIFWYEANKRNKKA